MWPTCSAKRQFLLATAKRTKTTPPPIGWQCIGHCWLYKQDNHMTKRIYAQVTVEASTLRICSISSSSHYFVFTSIKDAAKNSSQTMNSNSHVVNGNGLLVNGGVNGIANGIANGYDTCDMSVYPVKGEGTKGSVPASNKNTSTAVNGENQYTYEVLQGIASYLLARTDIRPKIGIICGTGLGSLADHLTDIKCFPYSTIPHFPTSTVVGHAGQLVFGRLQGVQVMCMQGRFHSYEGYPLWKCSMPVRVMHLVGVTSMIVTNAAGGLNVNYRAGDIMIIKDHINLMGFAGNNPLQGHNDDRFGPRFLPMNTAYNVDLREHCKSVAAELGIADIVREGVYTCVGGPNFETIAELQMLRLLGVDAVGMSTVPEVLMAIHCGMTVFGFSLITNECIMDYDCRHSATHDEVMDVGNLRKDVLREIVCKMVDKMAAL